MHRAVLRCKQQYYIKIEIFGKQVMIFRISGLGNLGNRMMQYMSASYFQDIFPGSSLANVHLPEWGIEYEDIPEEILNDLKILEDASMDIAKGYYFNARDHFLKKGIWEGRMPVPPEYEDKKILSLHKTAITSSTSEFSCGQTREEQGKNSIDSSYVKDYSFHTKSEYNPWLEIDLYKNYNISRIEVYNRDYNDENYKKIIQKRCIPLYVYGSKNRIEWYLIHVEEKLFGANYNDRLIIEIYPKVEFRFIKLSTPKKECLHLKKVHIYGE